MNKISIVIPVYNEIDNIIDLINEIKSCLLNIYKYEIIVVDDFSNDGSDKEIIKKHKDVILIKNDKNMGQSFSICNGINKANFDNIVTLDGDGQNPPKDINKIADIYFSSNFQLVGGLRINRKDSLIKKISSKLANQIRSIILSDNCSDTGCSLKIFNKNYFVKIPFFKGMHRFLPALFLAYGAQTYFIEVGHRPRLKGKSKYGTFDRLIKGIKDLIKVFYLVNNIKK